MSETGKQLDTPAVNPRLRCLDIEAVCAATGESRSVIYQKVRSGNFPKPIKIGRRAKWREITLIKHLEQKDRKAGNL